LHRCERVSVGARRRERVREGVRGCGRRAVQCSAVREDWANRVGKGECHSPRGKEVKAEVGG
jgi:hypothetical protein